MIAALLLPAAVAATMNASAPAAPQTFPWPTPFYQTDDLVGHFTVLPNGQAVPIPNAIPTPAMIPAPPYAEISPVDPPAGAVWTCGDDLCAATLHGGVNRWGDMTPAERAEIVRAINNPVVQVGR